MSAPSGSTPTSEASPAPCALPKVWPAGGERRGLLVVHAHAAEGLAHVARRTLGIRIAARPLRVDVDQPVLDRRQRVLQREARLLVDAGLAEPLLLGAPVDVLLRLEHVLAAAAEAEHRAAHALDGDVAGQDHQVGPAERPAVLLLDRPEQAARLVQVAVVRPAVQRGEALRAGGGAAAAVAGAVAAGAVPGHADEEGAVVAVVRRPPGLAVGHQRVQVALHRRVVERLERGGIVEAVAERVVLLALAGEDVERQLVGPPVAVGAAQQRAQRGLLDRAALQLALVDRVHERPPRLRVDAAAWGGAQRPELPAPADWTQSSRIPIYQSNDLKRFL